MMLQVSKSLLGLPCRGTHGKQAHIHSVCCLVLSTAVHSNLPERGAAPPRKGWRSHSGTLENARSFREYHSVAARFSPRHLTKRREMQRLHVPTKAGVKTGNEPLPSSLDPELELAKAPPATKVHTRSQPALNPFTSTGMPKSGEEGAVGSEGPPKRRPGSAGCNSRK